MQIPRMPFEVRRFVEPIARSERLELIGGQLRGDLALVPDIKLPFLALGVGVEARGVAAFRRLHFPDQPCRGAFAYFAKQRFVRELPRFGVQAKQWTIVVEHLFEMRDQPALVGAVATEAAAELIENPAFAHPA